MSHYRKYEWSYVTLSSAAAAILKLLLEHLAVQTEMEVKKQAFLNFSNLILIISSALRLLYLVE